ncbi:bifunctional DNA-formamidopyrimidine glycosylase/DNA-(apurinic or apyrimidinic site) lyase [Aestuariibacter halophilus]|uniref:Formamidopyrimidine-DNA glycosylase n=1 Tax=Fluctibacter halophilus TaxID=226011 RepID=A0ABS8GAC9_9ALTE|nr:bifunctional DNA-formamidopyrimidine glycosylase/DNA-(apurinic or apyrimidinic site) lyase [Aestuariibacter halophilus]MCC2617510.1 bifunctional DNA-formamidopyrimidine glycosylase/DNA-(apurinic or apyrimidinic site) lyase [Aestuariibacter halophilus]
MPELPEVEVSRQGIAPHMIGQSITAIVVRQPQLRWPVPDAVQQATGQVIHAVRRRAKYLFIDTPMGSVVLHLGMSGRLRVIPASTPVAKHDHLDIVLDNGQCLRFHDPRRFGACLWQGQDDPSLPLLEKLGPEPLTDEFDGKHLHLFSSGKKVAVKNFIMDNHVVVGVGNIYANEALFASGIDPRKPAGKVSRSRYDRLADNIKNVLSRAIEQGGTTLKDFTQTDGKPGYFAQHLRVYGRANAPCEVCETPIKSVTIGQRNSFYCPQCQR